MHQQINFVIYNYYIQKQNKLSHSHVVIHQYILM
ncbi:unnamed protein product [Trichobilharzia regenti]|nr:unnamed protein product [Trichobilharzia regenti]